MIIRRVPGEVQPKSTGSDLVCSFQLRAES